MTKKTLLKKLIAHYTKAGEEVRENDWRELVSGEMDSGVCDLASSIFEVEISNKEWVYYWTSFDGIEAKGWAWIKLMNECESLPELLANIETRIEIMCHELYSGVE